MQSKPSGQAQRPETQLEEECDRFCGRYRETGRELEFGGGSTARLQGPGRAKSDSSVLSKARMINSCVWEENWVLGHHQVDGNGWVEG